MIDIFMIRDSSKFSVGIFTLKYSYTYCTLEVLFVFFLLGIYKFSTYHYLLLLLLSQLYVKYRKLISRTKSIKNFIFISHIKA